MTREQVEELIDRMARPTMIYRMARNDTRPGAEKRRWMAHKEIEDIIADLFGPDMEHEQ